MGNECPAGHYCPVSTSFASQFPCPRGTYKPQRGGVRQSDCTPCEPGKGTGTYPCPNHIRPHCPWPARHGSDGGTLATAQCAHQISPHWLVGEVPPFLHPTPPKPWDPCLFLRPTGSYCLLPGLAAVSGPCGAGFHCTRGSSVPNPTDGITGDLCPPGHFCPQGSPRPTPCPPGKSPAGERPQFILLLALEKGRCGGPDLGA